MAAFNSSIPTATTHVDVVKAVASKICVKSSKISNDSVRIPSSQDVHFCSGTVPSYWGRRISFRATSTRYSTLPVLTVVSEAMTASVPYEMCGVPATDLSPDCYVVVGLATCFRKGSGGPKDIKQIQVLEPLPESTFFSVTIGADTSYKTLYATTLGDLLPPGSATPAPVIPSIFADAEAELCEDFQERAMSAARTWKRKLQEEPIPLPLGQTFDKLNFSLERKRILNYVPVVNDSDNVKQHVNTHKNLLDEEGSE
eukprot:CAMPEP_0196663148 /NCGR_PEP_ID=MMETSP1086-20130531/51677_1 /TAXON_ID=77921 /ORGANISM="Cyanoptyche  gloeocystis , Strain SAG4.97" /LENGTH=255 /DNA_ID=CAMNT_0041998855 /DNA_START=68 /DNA_END=835 /DNA_ORIENTATION=+